MSLTPFCHKLTIFSAIISDVARYSYPAYCIGLCSSAACASAVLLHKAVQHRICG